MEVPSERPRKQQRRRAQAQLTPLGGWHRARANLAQAQERVKCLEVSSDRKVTSALGPIFGASTLAWWSKPENVRSHYAGYYI